jgi:hypothetical protein
MFYEEVRAVVDRAAELLPEPPRPGNAGAYGQWEALTIDTCRRLAWVLDADTDLIRSLISNEQGSSASCRERRRLLLRATLLVALQLGRAEPAGPRLHCERPAEGIINVTAAQAAPHRFAACPGRLDAA